jgi:predicted O-methyltransferase YrrM
MHHAEDEATFNAASIASRAGRLLPDFRRAIETVPRESGFKGIGLRGMFFFYAAVRPFDPKQILESGRMRGESTLVLARCFPQARIVSVEFDLDPAHAAIAEAKLRPYANVELLYGDSREILPQQLRAGDAVLIDGPKEFRALKLALRLLVTGKPCAVLIHDFYRGQPARKFIERHWPGAFFSDDPALAARFRDLGSQIDPAYDPDSKHSASPFVCLPPNLPASYSALLFKIIWARAVSIAVSKIGKFLPHSRSGKVSDSEG